MGDRPTTAKQALAFFGGLQPSVMRMGLDRMALALDALGRPDHAYPIVHVAGTNGKGSTCAFVTAALQAQGYRVGLYTSPHLVRVNERFRVNGEPISDSAMGQAILALFERLPGLLEVPPSLTFFEVRTLLALWHFAQETVDVAVVETGLGGRLDATSAARPTVSGISSIALDHTDILGQTLPAIAREKAGIFKPNVPAVSARQKPEVLLALEEAAHGVGTRLWVAGRDFELEPDGSGQLKYRGMRTSVSGISLGLKGDHQRLNAALACACLELLEDQGLRLSQDSLRAGLAGARWEGRLEEVAQQPTVLVDGAHNPAAAEALAAALDALYPGRSIRLVLGLLADKDRRPILRALLPRAASVHLARPHNGRGLEPERYLNEARELCREEGAVTVYPSIPAALEAALEAARAVSKSDLVVATGSLSVVGEVKAALRACPATS